MRFGFLKIFVFEKIFAKIIIFPKAFAKRCLRRSNAQGGLKNWLFWRQQKESGDFRENVKLKMPFRFNPRYN
jgi:hypothetical protein